MPRRTREKPDSRRARALRESLKYSPLDTDVPADMAVFRLALARHLRTVLGDARRCRERVCRRTQRCAGPDMHCARDLPAPPATPEQWARVQAEFRHAIERRLSELPP